MEKKRFFSAKNVAYLAVLTALVVVLQTCGGFFKIGTTSLSFVLVPIVLGAVLLGPLSGAFLGFLFGLIVWLYGVTGADAFTAVLWTNHPVLTFLTCFVKGIAAGLVPGLIYPLIAKKNKLAGVIVASALAPILNTGLFIVGALTMSGTLMANFVAEDSTLVYFLFIGCAGLNFIVEFALNLVLSPAIHRVVLVTEKAFRKKHETPALEEWGELNEVELPSAESEILPESEPKQLPEARLLSEDMQEISERQEETEHRE